MQEQGNEFFLHAIDTYHGGVDGCQQKEPRVCWGGCVVVVASSVQHSCPVLLLLLPPSHLLLPGPSFDLTPGCCCSCCCCCCCCGAAAAAADGGGLQFSFPHYRYCYSLPRRPPRRLQNWVELKKDLEPNFLNIFILYSKENLTYKLDVGHTPFFGLF
jgi:hypothetical protein